MAYPFETLRRIAALAQEHDLLVVSDEIYAELTYGAEHVCFASLEGMRERTVLLSGFSKSFAMTGWRLGYAVGPAPLIEAMEKIHQYGMLCAPTTSQLAVIEALGNGRRDLAAIRRTFDQRRRLMIGHLARMGLPCPPVKGAFYAFPSIAHLGLSSEDFCALLLEEQAVACVPGTAFGPGGEGHIRCSFAVRDDKLEEALSRMARFVEKINHR